MTKLDETEKKQRAVNAASSAFSALSELVQGRTEVKRPTVEKDESSFKDHEINPLDKLIGPNGLFRGFRIILILTGVLIFVFFKINEMILQIPTVVSERKISETLAVQSGNSAGMLVSPVITYNKRIDEDANTKPANKFSDDDTVKRLRGEVEKLKSQLAKQKETEATFPPEDQSFAKTEVTGEEAVGVVRDDHAMRVLLIQGKVDNIGQVMRSDNV